MSNTERIQANNAELRECISIAESLPDAGGGDENLLQYATFQNNGMFRDAVFPENYHADFKVQGNSDVISLASLFAYSNAERVSIELGTETVKNGISLHNLCIGCIKLTDLYLKNNPISPTSITNIVQDCTSLNTVHGLIDASKLANLTTSFSKCHKLRNVRFVANTIKVSLSMAYSSLLTDETIQNIIDGLATVETAMTLTLHADVKAKLTDAQIATITSKNWNLA